MNGKVLTVDATDTVAQAVAVTGGKIVAVSKDPPAGTSRIGSIEVGKDADIAVWDRDMLTVPSDDLKDLKAELTLMQGKVVYQGSK